MLRPIWFYFDAQRFGKPEAVIKGILCIGNPAIFWMIPVAIGYLIWDFCKRRAWASGLVLLGFFTQWLPYAFFGRLKFFHYFYTAMPFVAMALALLLSRLWAWGKPGRVIVVLYLILVAGMFVYWYPLLTALPVSGKFFQHHMWFKKWI